MYLRITTLAAVAVLLTSSVAVQAQQQRRGVGFRGARGPLDLAGVPAVVKSLKLNDEQAQKAKDLIAQYREERGKLFEGADQLSQEERRERFTKLRETAQGMEKKLAEAVGEEKFKRLQQIGRQVAGVTAAFAGQETAEQLGLTQEQREQARTKIREVFQGRNNNTDAEARRQARQKLQEELEALLTDEQKTKWKEMLGEPAGEELLTAIRNAGRRRRQQN